MSQSVSHTVAPSVENTGQTTQFNWADDVTVSPAHIVALQREAQAVTLGPVATYTSLNPIQLNGAVERGKFTLAINAGGTVGPAGVLIQINAKTTPTAPWVTIYSAAFIAALPAIGAGGIPPLIVFAPGQASVIFPVNSSCVFDLDCKGFHAIDFQASAGTGSTGVVTATLFSGLRRGGG